MDKKTLLEVLFIELSERVNYNYKERWDEETLSMKIIDKVSKDLNIDESFNYSFKCLSIINKININSTKNNTNALWILIKDNNQILNNILIISVYLGFKNNKYTLEIDAETLLNYTKLLNKKYNRLEDKYKNKKKEKQLNQSLVKFKEKLNLYEDKINKAINEKKEYEILLEDVEQSKDKLHIAYLDEKEANEEKNKKIEELKKEIEELKGEKEIGIKYDKEKILRSWNIYFDKMVFDSQPLKWTADKNYNERLDVEEALKELHEMDDPNNISRGKIKGLPDEPSHCEFKLGNRTARIIYKVKNNKIYILFIYLRAEQKKVFDNYLVKNQLE